MGTPGYLSPEHCTGEPVDHRADIYALGVTYYEMLTGRLPFNAESPLALLRQILQEEVPDVTQLNSEVDPESKRILMKMIARDRNQRYQSCHELTADLEEYLASRNVRNVTASLATKSVAVAGAAATPTVVVNAANATVPQTAAAQAAAPVTAPGNAPFVQPATQPTPMVAPSPAAAPKKSNAFALIAAIAILAFVGAVGAAGVIGYRYWKGRTAAAPVSASVLPLTSAEKRVELSNPVPNALDTAQPSGAPAPSPAPVQTPIATAVPTPAHVSTPAPKSSSTSAPAPTRAPAPAPVKRSNKVAIAVQGDSGLNSAVADVLSSELSSAGLDVVNADDLPATEGMAGSASAGALIHRLGNSAGILVIARIEATGQRELNYMGRSDTAYGSRVNVTVYDVASGNPIGSRASAPVEYTQLNAQRKAEEAVAPLARKAAEAIQNH